MVLNPANQLSTTLHTSIALEPLPHFHGVEIAPRFHGIGIFYGTRCSQFMLLMHSTNSIQPFALPWRRNLYGTRCSQPAQYSPPCFHGVRTISTLSWCRNYSMHPRLRNLFMVLNEASHLGTILCTSMAQEPFMVLDLANQLDTTFHTSTV